MSMDKVVQKMLGVRMERELSPRICTFKKLLGELDSWKKKIIGSRNRD